MNAPMPKPESREQISALAETLLPCPFCQRAPKLANGKVKCVNLGCKVQPTTKAWYVKGYFAQAVTDWNQRARL